MFLTEDKLIDWINSKEGLLITRRTLNVNHFDFNRKYNTLYVGITGYSQIIEQFFNIFLKKLINVDKVIVIIIESDVVNINKEWLNNEKINKIYTWNKPFENEKIKCIPIGLNYNRQYDIINYWINKNDIKDIQNNKTKLLCMNCSLSTSPERVKLNEIVKNKWGTFCDILPFVPNIRQYFIPSHIEGKIRINVTNPKCYDDWKPYKFILSPQGAGLDCHRTWEAIICGIIPIVKSSSIDELFQDLPVIIVNDWNDINENMLNYKYTEIMNKWNNNEYNIDKIMLKYWTDLIDNNSNDKKIHFITYGNKKYENAVKRICKQADDFFVFETIKGYGPNDLPKDFKDNYNDVLSQERGGGYWLWKPILLYEKMKQINDNEYIVYLDAGCQLNKHGIIRFNEYIKMLDESELGILSFQMKTQKEKWWTIREIFEYYNIDNDGEHANTGQLVGGVFIIKKNKHSLEYVEKLVSTAMNQSQLYTDKFNKNGRQAQWFKDNRHDQSFSSILRKIHGSIIVPNDESFIVPFGGKESLKYPFWASRSKS